MSANLRSVLAIGFLLLWSAPRIAAQQQTTAAREPAQDLRPAAAEPAPPQTSRPSVSQDLDRRVQALQSQVDSLTTAATIGGTFLAVFLALGAAGSLFSLWNFERRTKEAHSLAIRGEQASQQRAAEVHEGFLKGSKETLDLVNATLLLAKEASERAAHFLEEKARESLETLDSEAKALLASAPRGDDRSLISDQRRRSSLISLALRLGGFEINRFILPRDIRLTPSCLFVRGMDHHLRQQFEDALSYWRQVALDEKGERPLRSQAWYWIGYEHNNLGEFAQAVSSFEQALALAEGTRCYELRRILLESRFFNKSETRPEDLIAPFELLLKSLETEPQSEELTTRQRKIFCTLGNVLHVVGNAHRLEGRPKEAKAAYQRAVHFLSQASEKEKWARFGLAEALYRGGEIESARSLFRESVLRDAQTEAINRMEPRTKVLARETELICYYRLPETMDRRAHMKSQVLEALGDVDTRLTVYSQAQRRNVSRDEFARELESLEQEASEGERLALAGFSPGLPSAAGEVPGPVDGDQRPA